MGNYVQNKKIGDILRQKRLQLELTQKQIAEKIGLSCTVIGRIESGLGCVNLLRINAFAAAYKMDEEELRSTCDYKRIRVSTFVRDENVPVTIDDLEYLLVVSRGLQSPMNSGQILDLLKLRHPRQKT